MAKPCILLYIQCESNVKVVNIPEKDKFRTRDKWILHYIKGYKKGTLTLTEYWDKIIELKRDFDIEKRMM